MELPPVETGGSSLVDIDRSGIRGTSSFRAATRAPGRDSVVERRRVVDDQPRPASCGREFGGGATVPARPGF